MWGAYTAGTSTIANHDHIKIDSDLEIKKLVKADGTSLLDDYADSIADLSELASSETDAVTKGAADPSKMFFWV